MNDRCHLPNSTLDANGYLRRSANGEITWLGSTIAGTMYAVASRSLGSVIVRLEATSYTSWFEAILRYHPHGPLSRASPARKRTLS